MGRGRLTPNRALGRGVVRLIGVLTAIAGLGMAGASVVAAAPPQVKNFSQGFEANTSGWCDQPGSSNACDGMNNGTIDREPSGFSNFGQYARGIKSEQGKWHARIAGTANQSNGTCVGSGSGSNSPSNSCVGPYTDWHQGFGDSVFPKSGFTTSLHIYLGTSWAGRHQDVRFDWDTALNDNHGNYLQDYVFNAGTDPATSATPGFWINASTNAGRSSADPMNACPSPSTAPNTCRAPVHITKSGWYRFVHRFYNSGANGLAVQMKIVADSSNSTIANWTIYPGRATSSVGGPAVSWFPNEEIYGLPIDNAMLTVGH